MQLASFFNLALKSKTIRIYTTKTLVDCKTARWMEGNEGLDIDICSDRGFKRFPHKRVKCTYCSIRYCVQSFTEPAISNNAEFEHNYINHMPYHSLTQPCGPWRYW